MPQANDLSRCLATLEQGSTLVAVIELSQASWLVAGMVPGVERQPVKKIEADEAALLRLLGRWRDEAARAGRGACPEHHRGTTMEHHAGIGVSL